MYYKLTDSKMQTHGDFLWELGEWHSIDKELRSRRKTLCTEGWFHCYNDPLLAVLLNPIHAEIKTPRMFRCNVKGFRMCDHGIKFGFTFMRLAEEIEVPTISIVQRVAFGILCARRVYEEEAWQVWSKRWLSGEDRSCAAAYAAASGEAYKADSAAVYAVSAAASAASADSAAVSAVSAGRGFLYLKRLAKEAMKY